MSAPNDHFSPANYKEKVSEDYEKYETQEKDAGTTGFEDFIDNHFEELIDISQYAPLKYTDLLTSGLELNPNLPTQIKEKMRKLRFGLRRFIEEMAERIENYKYKSAEETIGQTRMSFLEREKTQALIQASKKIHISAQSMKVAMEVFINLNNKIVTEYKQGDNDSNKQRELILKNALIVCELLEFAIDYISTFGIKGIEDIKLIHREVIKDIEYRKEKERNLQQRAESKDEVAFEDSKAREAGLDIMLKKWEAQMEKVTALERSTNSMKDIIPTLNLRRDNAINQLEFFELAIVLKQVTEHVRLVEATPNELKKNLELIRLKPDDFLTLAGVSTGVESR